MLWSQLLKLAIKTIENEVIQNPETPIASVNIALTEILPVSALKYGLLSAESLRCCLPLVRCKAAVMLPSSSVGNSLDTTGMSY